MASPTPETHDMEGLRAARWQTASYGFTGDDTRRMEDRFRRPYRLRVIMRQAACRHDIDYTMRTAPVLYSPDHERALRIEDGGMKVRYELLDMDGAAASCVLDWTRYRFPVETDLINRIVNAWLLKGKIPSLDPSGGQTRRTMPSPTKQVSEPY